MLLDGLHIPLTTPFYPDGRVYLRKLEHNAERYSRTPASGLTVLTGTGESTLVSDDEARQIFAVAIAAAAPQKVMVANVSRDSVANTLELAEFVATLDYDAILLQVPKVLATSPEDVSARLTYFQAVADRSPLPIILSDHVSMSVETIAELAANPAFVGLILEAHGTEWIQQIQTATAGRVRETVVTHVFAPVTRRMATPQQPPSPGSYISAGSLGGGGTALATAPPPPAIKTRLKKVGFQVLSSRSSTLADALQAGAAGALLPLAAAAPQAVYEVFAAWKDGDPALAAEKQARLIAAAAEIEHRLGIAALKHACDLNGYFGGKPRLPLLPLSGEARSTVERLMAPMRN